MFSQIFNKARGLFPGTAADDSSFTAHASSTSEAITDSTIDSTPTVTDMVTATRRGQIGSPQTTDSDLAVNGKRKTRATRSNSQSNKRRRTESEGGDDNIERHHTSVVVEIPLRRKFAKDDVADEVPETQQTNGTSSDIEEEKEEAATDKPQNTTPTDSPKNANNHIRFGSEEPAPALNGTKEIPETQPVPPEEEASSDDDDEAPEAVDNSAQLLSLKVQAQKQEEARKRLVVLSLICAKHNF